MDSKRQPQGTATTKPSLRGRNDRGNLLNQAANQTDCHAALAMTNQWLTPDSLLSLCGLNSYRKMGPAHHFCLSELSSYADDGQGPSYTKTDIYQPLSIVSALWRQLSDIKFNLAQEVKASVFFAYFNIEQTLSAQLRLDNTEPDNKG